MLCDFPLHLPLELLGVDLTLQVKNEYQKKIDSAKSSFCVIVVIIMALHALHCDIVDLQLLIKASPLFCQLEV